MNLEMVDGSPREDSSSPLYLSNGDHLGLHLVSNHLVGSNYNSWNLAMTMALVAKNKPYFVDGFVLRPMIDDPIYSL